MVGVNNDTPTCDYDVMILLLMFYSRSFLIKNSISREVGLIKQMDLSHDELYVAIGYALLFASGSAGQVSTPKVASTPKVEVVKAAAAPKDDFDDMFGEDDEEETAADKARAERMAKALKLKEEKEAAEGKVKKEKVKVVEKSLVVLEVKPWEADTDLVAVWNEIRKYEQEGLSWGQTYKLEPIAYGKNVSVLYIICTILILADSL